MPCTQAIGALVSVLISGKCGDGNLAGVKAGDTFKMAFHTESISPIREIEGQGVVYDGISPLRVCTEDFTLTFSSGMHAHLGELGMTPSPDGVIPPTPNDLWFSIMKERVTTDGAWVSINPTDASKGFPLGFHGVLPPGGKTTTYGAVLDINLLRQTIPSLNILDSFGTYTASDAVSATFKIWRGWSANTALTCEVTEMKISPEVA